MKTQKQNYLSPVTETLVVRFEGVVCTSFSNGNESIGDQSDWDGIDDWQ